MSVANAAKRERNRRFIVLRATSPSPAVSRKAIETQPTADQPTHALLGLRSPLHFPGGRCSKEESELIRKCLAADLGARLGFHMPKSRRLSEDRPPLRLAGSAQ